MNEFCEKNRKRLGIYCYRKDPHLYFGDYDIPFCSRSKKEFDDEFPYLTINYGETAKSTNILINLTRGNISDMNACFSGFCFTHVTMKSLGYLSEGRRRFAKAHECFLEFAEDFDVKHLALYCLTVSQLKIMLDVWNVESLELYMLKIPIKELLELENLKKVPSITYDISDIDEYFCNGMNIAETARGRRYLCINDNRISPSTIWNAFNYIYGKETMDVPDELLLISRNCNYENWDPCQDVPLYLPMDFVYSGQFTLENGNIYDVWIMKVENTESCRMLSINRKASGKLAVSVKTVQSQNELALVLADMMNCKGYVLLCVACFVCLHLLCRLFLFRKRVVDPRPIEVKLKEHGIIIKEVLPIAEGGDSIICPYSIIDLFPLVSHLRIGLHDVFELLHQPAESREETLKRSKMIQIIESILQEQEEILAAEIDLEMSKYWAVNESSTADPNLSAPVNYDLPQLPRDYFKDLIREESLSSKLAEQEFTDRLNQTIQSHRIDSMETIKRIFNSINGGRLPWEIFAPEYLEDYISKDDAQYKEWFYDRSIFKTYPNETLSLLSLGAPMIKGVESRPSKYQLLLHICHPTYYARKKVNQKLYRIETEPQLVDDYYAQPILPELIAIEDGHLDTAKTISNWGMMGQHKSFFLHDGKFVGKMEELPYDCNVKAKTGCQFILTPKYKFEAENPEKVAEMRAAQSEASLNLTLKGDL